MLPIRLCALVPAAVLGATAFNGQPQAGTPDAPALRAPMKGDDAAIAAGSAAIERARRVYAEARTYADHFELVTRIRSAPETGAPLIEQKESYDLAFESPNRIALTAAGGRVVCDGTHLHVESDFVSQHVQSDAPDRIDLDAIWARHDNLVTSWHPAAYALTGSSQFDALARIAKVTGSTPETRDGRPGLRVGVRFDAFLFPEGEAPGEIWFDGATGLPHEIQFDLTAMFKAQMGDALESAETAFTMSDVRLNEGLANDAFTFVPSAGSVPVERFSFQAPRPPQPREQARLVRTGEPAPPFAGSALDGEPISLEQYRGEIVLIDFWATWCGPCVATIPQIQTIHEKYRHKGVVVLGVSLDRPGDEPAIRAFLDRTGITFRQFHDRDDAVANAYGVDSIPCSVLIDGEGVVRRVHVGGSAGLGAQIASELDHLLAGEDLPAEAAADAPTVTTAPKSLELAEVAPDRLAEPHRTRLSGYEASTTLDENGDGVDDLLVYSPADASFAILDGAQGSATYRGIMAPGPDTIVMELLPVHAADEPIVLMHVEHVLRDQRTSLIAYNLRGERLWMFDPGLDQGAPCRLQVAAADMDGDGDDEIVALIARWNPSLRDRAQGSYVAVLDDRGRVVCLRTLDEDAAAMRIVPGPDGAAVHLIRFDGVTTFRLRE